MMKKLIFISMSIAMALLLNQCSPSDVEKEGDKIITDLTTKEARTKEAVELSITEGRFRTYVTESINNGAAASTVTLDNQSGEDALVKLIRSDDESLWVPVRVADKTQASVNIVEGRYYIKIRYGAPGAYRYIRGDQFDSTGGVKTQTITLQKINDGDNQSNIISESQF